MPCNLINLNSRIKCSSIKKRVEKTKNKVCTVVSVSCHHENPIHFTRGLTVQYFSSSKTFAIHTGNPKRKISVKELVSQILVHLWQCLIINKYTIHISPHSMNMIFCSGFTTFHKTLRTQSWTILPAMWTWLSFACLKWESMRMKCLVRDGREKVILIKFSPHTACTKTRINFLLSVVYCTTTNLHSAEWVFGFKH